MRRVIIIALLAFALSACAPDPRREADAYATHKQADEQAAAQEQARAQKAETYDLWMSHLREVSQWISTMMMTSMVAAMFTVFISLSSLGIGISIIIVSASISTAKRNLARPNLIRLDPITRQYPLLITKISDGKYTLSNPNTESVTMLYDRNPADRMMIQAMSATQHDGALAYQARMSHRPGEIAQIQAPQIIEVEQ